MLLDNTLLITLYNLTGELYSCINYLFLGYPPIRVHFVRNCNFNFNSNKVLLFNHSMYFLCFRDNLRGNTEYSAEHDC